MTNSYFDSGDYTPVTRNTLARAEQVNDIASAIVTGFDLLPDPTALDQDRVTYAATVGGTANAITLTLPNTLASYTAGLSVSFKAAADNTGATTVNIDAVGAKAVKSPGGAALAGGEIQQDAIVTLSYNGTDFILTSGYLSTDTQTVAGIAADVTTVAGISGNVTTVAGISANVTTVAGISANVTTVAGISANVTTVAGISASVTTVAARDADIGTVAARDADIGIVADRDADIATVATRDADIATLADIEDGTTATGAIQTVAGIAANVTTVAGVSANVTTVAGVSANVTTVAGVAADVTTVAAIGGADISAVAAVDAEVATVAGVAANVTTVAGISANVTTVAGISANVTTVAGISANVTTVATNISDVNDVADAINSGSPASALPVTATGTATARTLANRFADMTNIKDEGATGDGVTNDSAALAAVHTDFAGDGFTLFWPAGDYVINSAQTYEPYSTRDFFANAHWRGAGGHHTYLGTRVQLLGGDATTAGLTIRSGVQTSFEDINFVGGSSDLALIKIMADGAVPAYSSFNITFRRCRFASTTPLAATLLLNNCSNITFEDCVFQGAETAVQIGTEALDAENTGTFGGGTADQIVFRQCQMQGNVVIYRSRGVLFDHCIFDANTADGDRGSQVYAAGDEVAKGVVFLNCWAGYGDDTGTFITTGSGWTGLVVMGTYIATYAKGIVLAASGANARIVGSEFALDSSGAIGVQIASGFGYAEIAGNDWTGMHGTSTDVDDNRTYPVAAAFNDLPMRLLAPAGTQANPAIGQAGGAGIWFPSTTSAAFTGSLGLGTGTLTGYGLRASLNLTGATTAYGSAFGLTVQSDVTATAYGFYSAISTQAASFTLSTLIHFMADGLSFGVGSTVSAQYGFRVGSGLTGGTENFAFYSSLPAASGRWNLYMQGSAVNYLAGNTGIGEAAPDYKLDVNGTFGFTPGASVTPVDNGDIVFEFTDNTTVTIKAKGSDGTVRSLAWTVAP